MTEIKLAVYAPFEVITHNKPNDCWLSLLGRVLDVTPLVREYKDKDCIKPILAFAGKDVSHWFDEKTGEIQHFVHPVTGVLVPYCPHGPLPDVACQVPSTTWRPLEGTPWWLDNKYQIGVLTKLVRPIKIINILLGKAVVINVCCEDSFYRIQERYSLYTSEPDSYTWVYMDKLIEMDKTMDENGIPDDREKMAELGIPKSFFVPSVNLYFNDDLRHTEDLTDDEDELDAEICCTCQKDDEKIM
ncbi:cytochrome b5 domain-containing protein 1 [Tribolium madens]|uniref:cytochrome b5 domain-containing protein 1 n=1 Tax=Tribolium madens TaxID=41895 RepID=UPI001CF722BE|nr:cytochrome b5 domain-containing protein 1 [Tribolium madens]